MGMHESICEAHHTALLLVKQLRAKSLGDLSTNLQLHLIMYVDATHGLQHIPLYSIPYLVGIALRCELRITSTHAADWSSCECTAVEYVVYLRRPRIVSFRNDSRHL